MKGISYDLHARYMMEITKNLLLDLELNSHGISQPITFMYNDEMIHIKKSGKRIGKIFLKKYAIVIDIDTTSNLDIVDLIDSQTLTYFLIRNISTYIDIEIILNNTNIKY